jgi:hypothetical protein
VERLLLIFLLIITTLIANDCKREFKKYPELTQNGWSIRVSSQIDIYGCRVIPIFDLLVKLDAIEIMDAVEDNPSLMKEIIKLFKHKELLKAMYKNEEIKSLVVSNFGNKQFLINLNYLIKSKYNSAHRKKLLADSIYINYYILPSLNAKNTKELKKYFFLLKKLDLDELGVFSFVYGTLADQYSFLSLVNSFSNIKDKLSKKEMKLIIQYPEYIAYFLYPSKDEMHISGSSKIIKRKQQEYQNLMLSLYNDVYKYYLYKLDATRANEIALSTMENIHLYMVKNYNDYYNIKDLMKLLIKQGFIEDLWNQTNGTCLKKKVEEVFAVFGDGNLKNLLKLKSNENDLYRSLIYTNSQYKNISSLFYISNVYEKFNYQQWSIFKSLLYNFSVSNNDIYINSFVLKHLDKMKYFNKILQTYDWDRFVENDSDVLYGTSTKKYKYILLTSYPKDTDPSVFQYIGANRIENAKANLDKLYNISISDLETHNFTTFEKSMAGLNKIDWALTGAAIIAAPFTGGASLGYIALKTGAKQTGKFAVKKGMKYSAKRLGKKLIIQSKRLGNKVIKGARIVRQKAYKTFGKNSTNNFGKAINGAEGKVDNFIFGATIATGVAGFFAMPNNLEAKSMCGE